MPRWIWEWSYIGVIRCITSHVELGAEQRHWRRYVVAWRGSAEDRRAIAIADHISVITARPRADIPNPEPTGDGECALIDMDFGDGDECVGSVHDEYFESFVADTSITAQADCACKQKYVKKL